MTVGCRLRARAEVASRAASLHTWLFNFPKKEDIVDAPHLQRPEHIGRNGHTLGKRIWDSEKCRQDREQ